jgi:hypothetical protein
MQDVEVHACEFTSVVFLLVVAMTMAVVVVVFVVFVVGVVVVVVTAAHTLKVASKHECDDYHQVANERECKRQTHY